MNNKDSKWGAFLVCLYGTSKTQFHDHGIQNGNFKCKLYKTKRLRVLKRMEHGFPADLPTEEIALIVKTSFDAPYANVKFGKQAFSELGYPPFTRSVLDDPEILTSASQEVQTERARILSLCRQHQGIPTNSRSFRVAPNQVDLNTVRSGLLAGGICAETASFLNMINGQAGALFNLLHRSKTTAEACHGNTEAMAQDTREQKLERFKKSRNFTARVGFFSRNGMIDKDVLAEVQRIFENRKDNETRTTRKKNKGMVKL